MAGINRELNFCEESKYDILPSEDTLSFSFGTHDRQSSFIDNSYSKVCPPPSFQYSSINRSPIDKRMNFVHSKRNTSLSMAIDNNLLQSCCITVFGYSAGDWVELIEKLRSMGNIIKYQEKYKGYLNVQYGDAQEAACAMQLNGTLINGNFIGIKICEDIDFWSSRIENKNTNLERNETHNSIELPKQTRTWISDLVEYIFTW